MELKENFFMDVSGGIGMFKDQVSFEKFLSKSEKSKDITKQVRFGLSLSDWEVDNLQTSKDVIDSLQATLARVREQHAEIGRSHIRLQTENRELSKIGDEYLEKANARALDFQAKNEELEVKRDQLQARNNALLEEIDNLKQRLDNRNKEIEQLKAANPIPVNIANECDFLKENYEHNRRTAQNRAR